MHEVSNEVYRLRRSEKNQDMVDDQVPCFVTEGGPSGNAAQPEHLEAVKVTWDNTEAEARKGHKTSTTVHNVDEEPVTSNTFTPK